MEIRLTRDPDVTIEARLKVDPEFAVALYHEQRKQIAELADLLVESGERIKKQSERIDELEAVLTGIANADLKDWDWCEGMNKNERNTEFRAWVQSIVRNAIKTQG